MLTYLSDNAIRARHKGPSCRLEVFHIRITSGRVGGHLMRHEGHPWTRSPMDKIEFPEDQVVPMDAIAPRLSGLKSHS
jgi:hypothetical protein